MSGPGFIPYGKQWLDEADIQAVVDVLKSDFLTQGPQVEAFEKKLCELTGAKYAVALANGTAALHLAVAALELKAGAEGITSANTFVASANGLVYNGLRPLIADIEPDTGNISVESIEDHLTDRVEVIIPVHFAGQPADMERISALAKKRELYVIEDAAHAIGSKFKDGTPVGSCKFSDLTTFSFHPVKTITSGEGGAVTTNSKTLFERLKLLRTHGITKENLAVGQAPGPWYYEMQALGFNYRITDIQAALGASQLGKLDSFVKRRREIVAQYNDAFHDHSYAQPLVERRGLHSAFHLYVLPIDFEKLGKSRKQVMAELAAKGVGTQVHYIPVTHQPYYQKAFGTKPSSCPNAEAYYKKALSLPLYPKMTDADVERVIDAVLDVLRR